MDMPEIEDRESKRINQTPEPDRKVLFISYHFPPVGGGGVQRSTKFVKYLPEFGLLPIVLTVKEPYDFYYDDSLRNDIPPFVPIYRSTSIEPMKWIRKVIFRRWKKTISDAGKSAPPKKKTLKIRFLVKLKQYLLFPDNEILWFPFGVRKGLQVIKKEKPAAIFSTASPFTAHLMALYLSKRCRLPWLADFRDPWVDRANFPRNRWRLFIDRKLENLVLKHATRLTTVSEPLARHLQKLQPSSRVTVITNGYDEADFQKSISPEANSPHFTIVYTGILNPEANAENFFQAIHLLIQQREDFRRKVRLKFIGQLDNPGDFYNYNLLTRLGLKEFCDISEYQPHKSVIQEMMKATVLLLIIGDFPHNEVVMSGKLFEYLRAKRPIFAVVPPHGAAAQVIRETKSGMVVPNKDSQEIAAGLLRLFDAYLANKLDQQFRWKGIDRYERKYLAGKLANLIRSVIE
ncbi:MAG: glycosyltransferase family 4 protein [Calditrichia bacterium]